MVPVHDLDAVRTVNIHETHGTTVTNDPTGDARTLFPLQAALGYDLAQSLFVGPHNLVVEGVTDYWLISSASAYLAELGRTALRSDLTITPAGGAQKVSYMVALLTSEKLNVLILLDSEKDAKGTAERLVKSKLIRDQNIVFVADAFSSAPLPEEADIEDLLDPSVYESLVKESYSKELGKRSLKLNASIPRITKRVEAALNDMDVEFHKTRPMRLLLSKVGAKPQDIFTDDAIMRFETLFQRINVALDQIKSRGAQPFR